jgi:hypothetical protein
MSHQSERTLRDELEEIKARIIEIDKRLDKIEYSIVHMHLGRRF